MATSPNIDDDREAEADENLSVLDDELTSSSGSDSSHEEESEEDEEDNFQEEDEDEPTQIPPKKKPQIMASSSGLESRLASFLPQIEKANTELATDENLPAKRIDTVDDDEEHYIEMNLGLGVLKKKSVVNKKNIQIRDPDTDSSSGDSEDDHREEEDPAELSIIDKLKGDKPSSRAKRKIEEVC